jgi:hypothetical protein
MSDKNPLSMGGRIDCKTVMYQVSSKATYGSYVFSLVSRLGMVGRDEGVCAM